MITLPGKGLYAIADDLNLTSDELLEKTEQILDNGTVMLQYRNKDRDPALRQSRAASLQKLCRRFNVPFIVNDDIELARILNADGVHLGRNDTACRKARIMLGPASIIGISCYNDLERALVMEHSGASYVAFGAFFPTRTKTDPVKAEPELLRTAKQKLTLPIVAIGGITPENGRTLIEAGADFLAVISGLYAAADSAVATRNYVRLFNEHERS